MKPCLFSVLFVAGLLLGCNNPLWRQFGTHHGAVTVINNSRERIVSGRLEICGQGFELKDLPPGESRTFRYRVIGDDDYHLEVTFASKHTIKRRLGYVTSGFDFNEQLVVTEDNVRLGSSRIGNHVQ